MTDVASGTGQAFDATVAIGEASRADLEAALAAQREKEQAEEGPNRIRSLERKVDRLRQQLGEAEEWLAAEKAAQGV
jgi:hypothetical protein